MNMPKLPIYEICGDVPLSRADRCRYFVTNATRNLAAGAPIRSVPFQPKSIGRVQGRSPSRLLTDIFLDTMLPQFLRPSRVNVLEIGCGSGSMALRLARLGYSGTYTGVDISAERFNAAADGFEVIFENRSAHTYSPPAPVDLLISVSALEHIADDGILVRRLATSMASDGLEVHIVPAAAALPAYLWHGYRQYTVANLVERFGTDIEVYRLGGAACLAAHLMFITGPELLAHIQARRLAPSAYDACVRGAVAVDRWLSIWPTALVMVRRHTSKSR